MSEESVADQLSNLRKVPLFAELSDEVLNHVLERATEFDAADGHVLVQRNHPGAGLFIIEEGTVTVELPDKKVELGPGEFFGELALLSEGATHSARVCAAGPVRCLALARDDFDDLLDGQPRLAIAMLKALARRLAGTTSR